MDQQILAFSAVAAVLTVTPGVDMAIVTRHALELGSRPARRTAAGICTGLLVWAALSAVGVAALLAASAEAYNVLRFAGAAYLVYLGAQALLSAWRGHGIELAADEHFSSRAAYRQGLLSNLLNPKIAVFYTTLLPQFIEPGDPVLAVSLLLASIHAVMGLAWLWFYAGVVARAGDLLRRGWARRALDSASGLVLVALGVRLALERRP
jgi:threonine/homoserine/homoserine lactone efflux protein